MRFLHTADWHIGKPIRSRSRLDEYAAALDELLRIAKDGRVDAVLIAGDVFDTPSPPPEAERLVYDFLARLIPERIACVLIAGNHDHPKKLAALQHLLEGLRIHVRAEVRAPSQGGVVGFTSRDGREEAEVAVLPFVPERKIVDACAVMGPEDEWFKAYAERLTQMLAHLTRGMTPARVNLALAHLLIEGARVGTGVRALHLGQAYGVNAQQLPANVQYIGLGHLHRPQQLDAPSKAYYSGSLLELDFGEQDQDKRVLIVDAKPGGAATVESVGLATGKRLRDLTGPLAQVLQQGRETPNDWLRVRVRTDGPVPGIADQVKEALPNAVDIALSFERKVWEERATPARTLDQRQLFTEFYRRKHKGEPTAELLALFNAVHDEAQR
jgi:DNA repair protein SbcD/Mre11